MKKRKTTSNFIRAVKSGITSVSVYFLICIAVSQLIGKGSIENHLGRISFILAILAASWIGMKILKGNESGNIQMLLYGIMLQETILVIIPALILQAEWNHVFNTAIFCILGCLGGYPNIKLRRNIHSRRKQRLL